MTNRAMASVEQFQGAALTINKMVSDEIKTLSEATFISKLLPIMKEWVTEGNGENVHLWAIAAGGIERPMKVIVSDVEFFMVPPPYNQLSSINPETENENNQIHAMNKVSSMKERDGETREALKLNREISTKLYQEDDKETLVRYNIQLAKIWERYNLPVEQVLGTFNIDLDLYDVYGNYINKEQDVTPGASYDGEDEFEF